MKNLTGNFKELVINHLKEGQMYLKQTHLIQLLVVQLQVYQWVEQQQLLLIHLRILRE
jgi:hypothetical protein